MVAWLALLLPISGCSSEVLQRAFAPDPNAGQWGQVQAKLPEDFPTQLLYVNATLQSVQQVQRQATAGRPATVIQQTRWVTPAPVVAVHNFYQNLFRGAGWQQVHAQSRQGQTTLTARQQQLRVKITLPEGQIGASPQPRNNTPPPGGITQTVYTVEYYQARSQTALLPKQGTQLRTSPSTETGIVLSPASPASAEAIAFSDLNQAPPELQTYVQDLAQLGVLTSIDRGAQASTQLAPMQAITRGTFAQWLVQANNRLYQDRPTRQIRLATATSTPVFKDVSPSNPAFPYIQGLAEAGYLPSPLSGNQGQTLFRPNDPLTRETLLTWKVPVDQRRILPTTTAAKVQQVWGFKDINQISPTALSALLADHQNGDLANVRRVLGSALLLQPKKPVTRAEAAAALWFIGLEGEGFSAKDILRSQLQSTPSS